MTSSERPNFTLTIQDACKPKAVLVNEFVAVQIGGDEHNQAEVFVTTRAEAQAFIDVFTKARDMLPKEE